MSISGVFQSQRISANQVMTAPSRNSESSSGNNTSAHQSALLHTFTPLLGGGSGFISNPSALTSKAVSNSLLAAQETGSIFTAENQARMANRGVPDATQARFAEIVQEAAEKNAYDDPLAYLKSLSSEDIEVIRQVHCLAETSGVTGTKTVEGATNLLLPPSQHVDLDNNGLVNCGQATLFSFPPPNAPQAVKDAWKEMTASMPPEERLMAETAFFVPMAAANVKLDAEGNVVGLYEPDEEGYTNVFGTTTAEWRSLLDRMIANYESLIGRDPLAESRIAMLSDFESRIG